MAREKRRKGENPCLNKTEMPLPHNMTTRKRRMSLTRYTGLLDGHIRLPISTRLE